MHLFNKNPQLDQLLSSLNSSDAKVFVIRPEQNTVNPDFSKQEKEDYKNISSYLKYGGKENFENLLLYLLNRFVDTEYKFVAPVQPQWEGIYHPDFDYLPTLDEYLEKKILPSRFTIGICFHQSHLQSGDTNVVDRLIKEIEYQGANALPVFFSGSQDALNGTHGLDWVIENYFLKEGKPLVDVMISLLFFSFCMSPSGSNVLVALKKLGVPVIKAVLTCNSFEEWRDTIQGLSIADIPSQVALPEFDGFLITVPIGAMVFSQTNSLTGDHIIKYLPISEELLNWLV